MIFFFLFLHSVKSLCHGLGAGFMRVMPWHRESPGCWESCVVQAPWQLFSSKLELQHAPASHKSVVGLVVIPQSDLDVLFLPHSEKPLVVLHLLKWIHT